jgi:polyhydroxyalkanoate synthesis regulator phasin
MARELGGSQISALLESVPGIRSVLRSPVADALVQMIRAGAGFEPFRLDAAKELIQYAVRRGLISVDESEELLVDVTAVARKRRGRVKAGAKQPARTAKTKKVARKKAKHAPKKASRPKAAKKKKGKKR